jgi:hypothetical protein
VSYYRRKGNTARWIDSPVAEALRFLPGTAPVNLLGNNPLGRNC